MNGNIFISMEKEIFSGNILDIGLNNYGVVYNITKSCQEDCELQYLESEEGKKYIEESSYDNCILFFTLRNLNSKHKKRKLLKDIHSYLKESGTLHIWDIDKGMGKCFRDRIKVGLPNGKVQEIYINDINLLNDISKDSIIKLLHSENFDIISSICSDKVYNIKCKKRRITNEGIINSS